ncbi:hypothetical protein MNBD_GAMMA02-1413 [hydrothermal vent metagenome]|uniref:Uncharacterized protein n=1 Tax=hydrothermal vent metagenome TaxID=652676 RepID=A0A3B0W881_9ZZZZ
MYKINTSHHRPNRLNILYLMKWTVIITAMLQLSACGNNYPKLTQFKAFDERFTTVLDTQDPEKLKLLSELFFNRQQTDDVQAALSFDYLFDLTTSAGSERWRCTPNGYCQQRKEGAEPFREIFYVERYKELYRVTNID